MSRITSFTWDEFWAISDEYNGMMCEIEDRAFEIAQYMGRTEKIHQISEIFFSHDNTREYVNVEFCHNVDGAETFEYFKFDSHWLFSDDYKDEIATKEAHRKAEEEKEYQEYLRLKEKFENRD